MIREAIKKIVSADRVISLRIPFSRGIESLVAELERNVRSQISIKKY